MLTKKFHVVLGKEVTRINKHTISYLTYRISQLILLIILRMSF